MEWLASVPAIPLGGSIGAFIGLLMWLIKRGDINTVTTTAELRGQRDEQLKRANRLQDENDSMRARLNHCETELMMYRRLYGPLDADVLAQEHTKRSS